jgi:predicted AlkP superfamily pyrophosphatase or phosphodiesterase
MLRCLAAAALLAVLHGSTARGAEAERPHLVVLLVVDQMRADYVEWYGKQWKGGLRRLYDKGAWLKNARYPFLGTITCPGHFTISTGTNPRRHGMVMNSWYDRAQRKVIDCTDDATTAPVAYPPASAPRTGGESARNLLVPTLADEMAAQLPTPPRVAAFSMKARSAIGLAGHAPAVVLWFDGGRWSTSTAFAPEPTPWVGRFIAANPAAQGGPWERLLPATAYLNEDDGKGENEGSGWTRTFPHVIESKSAPFSRWPYSPSSGEYLATLARTALTEMKLGQGPGTDLLAISFSNTDLAGHKFGPRSHEVQDSLARLDATLGSLLQALDRQAPGRYVVALTADHGVAPIPEQTPDGGRLILSRLKEAASAIIAAELGPGAHVTEAIANDLYLADGVRDRLVAKAGALGRVLAALRKLPGIADAFDGAELADADKIEGEPKRAAALSYHAGRSGDLVIVPRPNWVVGEAGTNHGSTNEYDRHVPVLFFGRGIKPGVYPRAVTPADIAPTIGALLEVKMPKAEGAPITEVLAPSPRKRR